MKFIPHYFLILFGIALTGNISAQKKSHATFGKISPKDFDIASSIIDSNSNAVIMADVAFSRFTSNSKQTDFAILFERFTRIKILNKNGYDVATVQIPLYVDKEEQETLTSLKAFTYSLKDGSIIKVPFDAENVYTEKVDKNHVMKKFTLPNISEGCIIEFAYSIKSEFYFNLQDWFFQNKYPTLWSEYAVEIPHFFKYMFLGAGKTEYHINETKDIVDAFPFYTKSGFNAKNGVSTQDAAYTIKADVRRYRWVMKEIPAIPIEPFVFSILNHINSIQFQLAEIQYANQTPTKIMSDWPTVIEGLISNENFGLPFQQVHPWMNSEVSRLIQDSMSELTRARTIYEYIRDNFTCNENPGIYLSNPLKKVYDQRTGSVAEINLLLICMLKKAGVRSVPVILGTREYGVTHQHYPLLDRYNYVLAAIFIDTANIFLDATKRHIAFGKIPANCYNGYARMIYPNSESIFLSPDNLVDTRIVSVFLTGNDKALEGSYTSNMGYFESVEARNRIAQSGMESFRKGMPARQDIEITNITLKHLKDVDNNLALICDVRVPLDGAGAIYFAPLIGFEIENNPFQSAKRYHPVELPYKIDQTYTLNFQIPEGYNIEEVPASLRIMLNDNEGMYEYLIRVNGNEIQLRSRLVLYKATFMSQDYSALRDFYAAIINKQNEMIVLKKK